MCGMFEVPIADVVEIVLSNSVQSNDLKLRSIRPNFPLFSNASFLDGDLHGPYW